MQAKCSKCKIKKETTEFKKDKSKKLGRSSQCKECQNEKAMERYHVRKADIKKRNVQNNNLIRDRNYAFVFRWLRMFGECIDCGISDIRVLEFDHVRGEKYKGVKRMCSDFASIKKIKHEIKKCEVRCCNCHRIKTQDTLGWRTK